MADIENVRRKTQGIRKQEDTESLLDEIKEEGIPTVDATGHVYGARRGSCCGYPNTKACLSGTFISLKFWASLAGVLFVFITLLVIDAKVNKSIYLTQALAYWNMNEVEKIENLTHDCVCIQYMCQENANGTKTVHNNPVPPGKVGVH